MNIQIALSLKLTDALTYSIPESARQQLVPGTRVVVPVGRRLETGWVLGMDSGYGGRVRPVAGWIPDSFRISPLFMAFATHAARRFLLSPGRLLDAALSPRRRNRRRISVRVGSRLRHLPSLSLTELTASGEALPLEFHLTVREPGDPGPHSGAAERGKGFRERLLLGYQRMDLYREIVEECLGEERSVILMTPDTAVATELQAGIPGAVAYHSGQPLSLRESTWSAAAGGMPVAVVGGYSALFLPFPRLGAVIVELPTAWRQMPGEWENHGGVELARLLAAVFQVPLIQGDNTHPLAAFRRRTFVSLEDRRQPEERKVRVTPIAPGVRGIPEEFMQELSRNLEAERHVLILINRRRGDDFLYCPRCRRSARCAVCGADLKGLENGGALCPTCKDSREHSGACPHCGGDWVRVPSVSLESLSNQIRLRILGTDPLEVTADTAAAALKTGSFQKGGGSVVLGTRAVLRPEFSQRFDTILYFRPESDFRFSGYDAGEQIQATVARLRELVKPGGRVDVFSTFHFHYGLRMLDEEEDYLQRESRYRLWFHLPPYADVFRLVCRESSLRRLGVRMREVRQLLEGHLHVREAMVDRQAIRRGRVSGHLIVCGGISALEHSGVRLQRDIRIIREA